jgi:hypothetical protein
MWSYTPNSRTLDGMIIKHKENFVITECCKMGGKISYVISEDIIEWSKLYIE